MRQNGYVALISAIIISVLLVTITVTLSFTSFYGRSNILDSEFKKISYGLASACVDIARLELAKNSSFSAPSQPIQIGDQNCTIVSITSSGSQRTIQAKADYKNATTNLQVIVALTPSNVTVSNWLEQ